MSQARWIERSFYPYALLLQVIPTLAIVSLIGLAFGFNFRSRVLVCTIIALFPIITNTLFGLKSASMDMYDLFTLQHARGGSGSGSSSSERRSRRSSQVFASRPVCR